MGGLQFTLLFQAGLRETHRLLDVGCGSLRGGRLFIPYLRAGHYYGVEPNEWLVEEGIANELGAEILTVKRPTSTSRWARWLIATFVEGEDGRPGAGWNYPDTVPYSWSDMSALAEDAGLEVRRLSWPQPRQVWFIGALQQDRVEEAAARINAADKPLV
jgi:hypothetical protein